MPVYHAYPLPRPQTFTPVYHVSNPPRPQTLTPVYPASSPRPHSYQFTMSLPLLDHKPSCQFTMSILLDHKYSRQLVLEILHAWVLVSHAQGFEDGEDQPHLQGHIGGCFDVYCQHVTHSGDDTRCGAEGYDGDAMRDYMMLGYIV